MFVNVPFPEKKTLLTSLHTRCLTAIGNINCIQRTRTYFKIHQTCFTEYEDHFQYVYIYSHLNQQVNVTAKHVMKACHIIFHLRTPIIKMSFL